MLAFAPRLWDGVETELATLNGEHAIALRRDGAVFGLVVVHASAERIDQVLWLMNPAKLGALELTGRLIYCD